MTFPIEPDKYDAIRAAAAAAAHQHDYLLFCLLEAGLYIVSALLALGAIYVVVRVVKYAWRSL